ncbi:MAG TPA: trypsin-like peptidase domain-containing protein [Gaiellaceae bacterium]
MLRAAASLGIAAVGGGVSLLGAGVTGNLGSKTTIQQVISRAPLRAVAPRATGLTVAQIYRRDAPGVVQVSTTASVRGSGFVIDKAGHIVTNARVVGGARDVRVSFSGTDEIGARVIGRDQASDVAVLQIDTQGRSLTPLPLGDSDRVAVGDPVVAIGNPLSITRTATSGIVSAVERNVDTPDGFTVGHAIQTDAAINIGNSGGPLIDTAGDVIGIDTQLASESSQGIGFAIPIDTVKAVVAQLIETGKVQHVFLGLSAEQVTPSLARLFDMPVSHGLLVQTVTPGSGAGNAGLRAGKTPVLVAGESYSLGGDIIVSVDGTPVATPAEFRDLLADHKPGDRLSFVLYRGLKRMDVEVTLGQPPG